MLGTRSLGTLVCYVTTLSMGILLPPVTLRLKVSTKVRYSLTADLNYVLKNCTVLLFT